MAIVIEKTPVDYSSIHDDLYYNVYEATKATDLVTYPDYKYVADIYINGVRRATQKASPHPLNNRGVFNLKSVVRNYITLNFNPAQGTLVAQEFSLNSFYINIQIKFGEEYAGVQYTNLVLSNTQKFFNHYNGRLVGAYTKLPSYFDKCATRRPLINNKVQVTSKNVFIPYLPTNTNQVKVSINAYTRQPGIQGEGFDYTFDFELSDNKYGEVYFQPTAAYNLMQLNVSPYIINQILPGAIDNSSLFYKVQIGTQEYTFQLYAEKIYVPRIIHFLNKQGGIESFEFGKLSKASLSIEKKGIGKPRANIDGTTYSGIIVNSNYNSYATKYSEKIKLNSDNLKEGHYKWLSEMVLSPLKWIEQDGFLIPVTFTDTNYEFKLDAVEKASKILSVEVDFNEDLNTQYL